MKQIDKRGRASCKIEEKGMGSYLDWKADKMAMEMGYENSPGLHIFIYFSLDLLSCIALKTELG